LYVTGNSDFVAVINTSTKKTKKIVLPQGISFSMPALTLNGRYLYDPSGNGNSIDMMDTKTNRVVGNPITVGAQPWKIAISSNGKRQATPDQGRLKAMGSARLC
jgi:DNA-binding beta-propeller fold protein YncE